jgi:hypothetical protein
MESERIFSGWVVPQNSKCIVCLPSANLSSLASHYELCCRGCCDQMDPIRSRSSPAQRRASAAHALVRARAQSPPPPPLLQAIRHGTGMTSALVAHALWHQVSWSPPG